MFALRMPETAPGSIDRGASRTAAAWLPFARVCQGAVAANDIAAARRSMLLSVSLRRSRHRVDRIRADGDAAWAAVRRGSECATREIQSRMRATGIRLAQWRVGAARARGQISERALGHVGVRDRSPTGSGTVAPR